MFPIRGWHVTRATRCIMALALLLAGCSEPPSTVDRITIVNTTGYDLEVQVTGLGRDGWLPLAIVEHQSDHLIQEVIDLGEGWTFLFLHWGDPVGEVSVTRAELRRGGWRVEVPEEVEERLRDLGRPSYE